MKAGQFFNNTNKTAIDAAQTSSSLPRQNKEYLPKLFRRSRQNKIRQIITPQRKRKQAKTSAKQTICYISKDSLKHSQHRETSLQKRQKQESNYQALKMQRVLSSPNLKEMERDFGDALKNQKEENMKLMDSFRQQNIKLKGINQILHKEILLIKSQKQSQARISQDLQQKIKQLTNKLKDSLIMIKNNENELKLLKKKLSLKNLQKTQESAKKNCKQQESLNKASGENSLQQIIAGLSKGIDQMFPQHSFVSEQSFTQQHTNNGEKTRLGKQSSDYIYELQNRIKYLEMEVGMLKKFKMDYNTMQSQCEIYKTQLKTYKQKLIFLVQNNSPKKNHLKNWNSIDQRSLNINQIDDSSISFQLSKDDLA